MCKCLVYPKCCASEVRSICPVQNWRLGRAVNFARYADLHRIWFMWSSTKYWILFMISLRHLSPLRASGEVTLNDDRVASSRMSTPLAPRSSGSGPLKEMELRTAFERSPRRPESTRRALSDYEITESSHSGAEEVDDDENNNFNNSEDEADDKFFFRQAMMKKMNYDPSRPEYKMHNPMSQLSHVQDTFPQSNHHNSKSFVTLKPNEETTTTPPRKNKGIDHYTSGVNKYVKNLFSVSFGSLFGGFSSKSAIGAGVSENNSSSLNASSVATMMGESPNASWNGSAGQDASLSESQVKLIIKIGSSESELAPATVPMGNSLLSKINKGINYTSSISKYLSSMPAVRSLTSPFFGAVSSIQDYFKLIKPGTQWCGNGDRAKSFEDLGVFYKTDACCRDHDRCPDYIISGAEKYGLTNDGSFTKLHCDCDVRFYQCLKSVNSFIAVSTGYEYFNILKPNCFKMEYPVIGCNALNKGKCVQYKLDSNHEKIWQWFDNKEFL